MRGGSCRPAQKNANLARVWRRWTTLTPRGQLTPWDRPNSVWSRIRRQHMSKKGNSNLQKRLRLLRKIARIESGPWSWTANLPQGWLGYLIRAAIRRSTEWLDNL